MKDAVVAVLIFGGLSFLAMLLVSQVIFRQCYKQRLGYYCEHRVMSNGKKECGPE